MENLMITDEKGLKEVLVFQLCECDAVAAYTLEDAKKWYKEQTRLNDDDLYSDDEIEIVNMDHKVYEDENREKQITVGEIIERYWDGKPFIAITTEY